MKTQIVTWKINLASLLQLRLNYGTQKKPGRPKGAHQTSATERSRKHRSKTNVEEEISTKIEKQGEYYIL